MKQRFRLILEPVPGSVPVFIRLRRALKMLLRAYGFRVTYINEERAQQPASEEKQADSA